jgi:magnesium transporter
MPSAAARQLIKLLTPEERRVAQSLLGYPEGSIGRLMTPDFIAVHDDWTVKEVLDHVREFGHDSETLNVIYVVDERGKLIDDLRMREFLLRPLEAKVSDFRDRVFVALKVNDSQEEALNSFRKYDRVALPVVDSNGVLVGIVTSDDMLDIAEEEATEDIQKFGGMEALDEPYMRISLLRMVRKRAGWLVILFLGEMLTASAMGYYEGEIAKAVVLALFLPLIISSGGNSGSQASTLIIRAMALGEVTLRDWFRVMRKEIMAGLMLGCVLGVIGFMRVAIWSQFSNIYGPHWPLVAMTVGFALIGVVLWGSISGSMLPFILRRLGADPATSSAPFVATLVDVTGLIIYFSIALLIMRGAML